MINFDRKPKYIVYIFPMEKKTIIKFPMENINFFVKNKNLRKEFLL